MAVIATAGLASVVLTVTGMSLSASPAAAVDAGCSALNGNDGSGTCIVTTSSVPANAVTVGEPLHLQAGAHIDLSKALSLTVSVGSMEMDKNSSIDGKGKSITVTVPNGNLTMHGTAGTDKCGYPSVPLNTLGAQIMSTPATLATSVTISVGNINGIPPTGSFTMERCSLVNVNGASGKSAGTVVITSGHDADVDGLVLSESTLSGSGATQAPGGGPIAIKAGCALTISTTGVVSSKGKDPGADLVHLEGCEVTIDGLVQSTGPGHAIPNSPKNHCGPPNRPQHLATDTGCVEVIGQDIAISSTGEVNADVSSTNSGGAGGTSWIDLFAAKNISITGKTGATDQFSVHADSYIGTDLSPNTVTAFAKGFVKATGKAFSTTDTANGSAGGTIDVEATGLVNLDTATLQAMGDNVGGGGGNPPPCDAGAGACGKGGTIKVRSWNDAITWQNGVGNVNPDRQPSVNAGLVFLTRCTTLTTTGTNFDDAVPTTAISCGAGPAFPSYVQNGTDGFFDIDAPIWGHCVLTDHIKTGMKFNDANNNHMFDAGDTLLAGWNIHIFLNGTTTDVAGSPQATVAANPGYEFFNLAPATYNACEEPQAGWVQTFPTLATVPPVGETVVTCANNTIGYRFTITNGESFTGNDFGNFHPTPPPPGGGKDATLLHSAKNLNNGANNSLRVHYQVASVVGFDVHNVDPNAVTKAILRLTVCSTPGDLNFCPDAPNGYPAAGSNITAFRLNDGWETWGSGIPPSSTPPEGNGNNFPILNNPRGNGAGVTWNCAIDTEVGNDGRDCTSAGFWNAGLNFQGAARQSLIPITNGLANGTTVDFDVTADVKAGLGPLDTTFMTWFIRKVSGGGDVFFYSFQGATAKGNPSLAPQLIITP